jgi:hypothetical protein
MAGVATVHNNLFRDRVQFLTDQGVKPSFAQFNS